MDHHDPSKLHTAEHEGHGVHVCRKCGWHFPNAHPSAKLRRSHKRICGTIEGYKLAGSEENPHLNVSDDEHLSDEDHKPPSTEVLETSNNEKGSGGIGERSNRSEYELFSDAVAEFSDGGITSAIEERLEDIQEPAINVEKVAKDDPNTSQPLRDGTLVDIKPQEISFDSSQMGNPEFPESTTDKLGSKPRSEDYVPSPTTTSMASSGSDYITEESVLLGNDRKCSPNDVNILKPETLTDASQENEKANAGEDVTECSLACVGLEIDGKRTEESSLDKNLMDSMVSHSRIGGRSFEIASNLEGTFGKTSDLVPADKVEKEHEDGSIYKVSQKDLPLKVDSADHVDVYGDTSEVWVDAARGVKDDSSCNIFEIGNREEKGNCNVDVLAVHSDSAIHVNASIGTSDMKVDAAEGIDRANFGHKIESCSRDTDEKGVNANVLSLPDDMSIVDPPETVVEDFEDNEAVKLQKYAALDSCVTSMDKKAGAENFASKANSSSIQSGQLNEGAKVPTSDIHVLKDSDEEEGGTINIVVNEVIVEEKADVSQTNVTIDEPGAPAEVFTLDIDENHTAQACEDETNDIHNCDLHVSRPEDAAKFLSDNRSNIEINEAVKLQKYAALDSCVTSMDKEAGAENFASKANSSSIQSGQLNEGTKVPTSDIHVSKDSDEQEGGTINSVVNEVIVEEKAEVSQTNVTIDEPGAPAEVFTLDIDENHSVQAREEETNDIHNCDLHVSRPEDAAKFLSDTRSNIAINLVGVDDIGKHEKAGTERFHVVGDNNGNCAAEENITNISSTNPESSRELSVPVVDPTMNFPEGDEDGDLVKGNLEKCDIDRNESREESQENDLSMKPKLSSEFASSLPESQIFADDIMDVPVKEFPERESMHLHGVPYSSRIGNNSVSDTGVKDELKGDNKVGLESLSISTPTEYDGGDVDSLEKPFEDHRTKESRVSPIEDKSSVPVSAIAEDNHARELGGSAAEITSGSLEGDSNFVKQHIGASTVDVSVDSYSQADSLEGNWGSVSVLSIQSDAAAVIDAETLPSSDNQALAETEAAHSEKPKAVPERQPSDKSDKSDMFEAPSFMTLVEPRDGAGQKAAVSEVQTGQNRQQQSASLQAGWFPSLSHVANESPGRKKNEEIIAKVTNWSTGKQHTPLKSLLSQASFESKQKSKKPKENPASALQNDETLSKDNGATSTALYTVLGPESPTTQAAKTEPKKEWNSPARYPSEIKTEKRKVKGRPYWVPFVCCSSVN